MRKVICQVNTSDCLMASVLLFNVYSLGSVINVYIMLGRLWIKSSSNFICLRLTGPSFVVSDKRAYCDCSMVGFVNTPTGSIYVYNIKAIE